MFHSFIVSVGGSHIRFNSNCMPFGNQFQFYIKVTQKRNEKKKIASNHDHHQVVQPYTHTPNFFFWNVLFFFLLFFYPIPASSLIMGAIIQMQSYSNFQIHFYFLLIELWGEKKINNFNFIKEIRNKSHQIPPFDPCRP